MLWPRALVAEVVVLMALPVRRPLHKPRQMPMHLGQGHKKKAWTGRKSAGARKEIHMRKPLQTRNAGTANPKVDVPLGEYLQLRNS